MKYLEISYISKLDQLQGVYETSVKLSEAIGVSRRSLLTWKDKPESIKPAHQLDIDVLYCKHFIVPEWDKPKQNFKAVLMPDAFTKKNGSSNNNNNEALLLPFLRRLSYGTIEIETNISRADFNKVIDEEKLPKNMSREQFHEAINAYFTHKWLWQKLVERQEHFELTQESIKALHEGFMRGVHDSAGFYSKKIRVMGKLERLQTTLPEDIPEEMHRWIFKHGKANTLSEIANAHAHFIAIHPFGDGNGRVGRALVLIQCLQSGLMPPMFDGENRALYYAAMEHAMVHGRYTPLSRLFHEAALRSLQL